MEVVPPPQRVSSRRVLGSHTKALRANLPRPLDMQPRDAARNEQPDSDSDTDDYGSSDGGGAESEAGYKGPQSSEEASSGGAFDRREQEMDGSDSTSEEDSEDDNDDDEDSEDDYGPAEGDAEVGSSVGHMSNAMTSLRLGDDRAGDESDSSDDRPLGELVDDPRALQKALREQERRRHLAKAQSALENGPARGTSQKTLRKMAAKASRSKPPVALSSTLDASGSDAPVDPSDFSRRLMRVQNRDDGTEARARMIGQGARVDPRTALARPNLAHSSSTDSNHTHSQGGLSRARSINHGSADQDPARALRGRPSDSAMRARARAHAQAHALGQAVGPTGTPMFPNNPAALAAVAAAQQAMANAKANPTSANVAQAKAMAAVATAAVAVSTRPLRSATMSGQMLPVNLQDASNGPPLGQPAGANLARARTEVKPHGRMDERRPALPNYPPSAPIANLNAAAAPRSPVLPEFHGQNISQEPERKSAGILAGLRPRARSRAHAPTINTAVHPSMPDTMLASPPLGSSSNHASPHSPNIAAFAAFQQSQASMDGHEQVANHPEPPSRASSSVAGGHRVSPVVVQAPLASPPPQASGQFDVGLHGSAQVQYKVFIINKQRFTMAEVPISARARDLVLHVVENEYVPQDEAKGGWVVFDCSPDFGIERPLREYEMVHEVADTRANVETDFFMLKRTELSPYLSIRAMPTSSPALAGWVYVQDRKKKWNKRWLELRDHALYHAKSEKGKDEVMICQISAFDVYLVDGSKVKTPKAHTFALRSQDKITMFEKPDQDYVHYFSLSDPAAHRDWVRAIMNARTYILRQERAVLFKPPPSAMREEGPGEGAPRSGGGASLSRRNTGRRGAGRGPASVEGAPDAGGAPHDAPPLPQAPPLINKDAFSGPFEKGSLLADMAIKSAADAMRVQGHNGLDRNAARVQEALRREEAIERQRRMRADGQPLIDLSRK